MTADAPSPTLALLAVSRVAELEVARVLEPRGLTLRRYGILQHVGETPGLTIGAIARRAEVSAQAAQVAVRNLIDADLVRSVGGTAGHTPQLSLTADGSDLLAEVAQQIAEIDGRLFPEARDDLARALLDM